MAAWGTSEHLFDLGQLLLQLLAFPLGALYGAGRLGFSHWQLLWVRWVLQADRTQVGEAFNGQPRPLVGQEGIRTPGTFRRRRGHRLADRRTSTRSPTRFNTNHFPPIRMSVRTLAPAS